MDPIPLNAVRAAAADVAADTSGTAVAAPVADIAGAAADIAADARAVALADAATDTAAVVAADTRAAALADAAAYVAAAVYSAGDLYRRACRALAASAVIVAFTSPAPPVDSDFEASNQGLAAVGPVRASVELLHANETTLKFG